MDVMSSDIQFLPGVGPKRAQLLKSELGVATFSDLIHLYPFRYIDRSQIWQIGGIRTDLAYVQVMARVVRVTLCGPSGSVFWQSSVRDGVQQRMSGQPLSGPADQPFPSATDHNGQPLDKNGKVLRFNAVKRLSVIVADSTGELELVFFKGIKWNFERLKPGMVFVFFGNRLVQGGNDVEEKSGIHAD